MPNAQGKQPGSSVINPVDRFVEVPGRGEAAGPLRLHVIDWQGTGAPIMLLHGLSSSARIWDRMAPLLARDFRVVALDQRGHGLSDKPESYSFAEVTGDAGGILDALGLGRPVVVGHSWGASVAVQFAADYPERTAGVVLIDGGLTDLSSRMTWAEAEKQMAPPQIDGVPLEAFLQNARTWPDFKELWDEQLQESLLSNFEVREEKVYRRLSVPNHMKILRAMYDQGPLELLARLECPVLAIVAVREPRSDREREWMQAREAGMRAAQGVLHNGRILRMEDTIHDAPVQRPGEIAALISEFARAHQVKPDPGSSKEHVG